MHPCYPLKKTQGALAGLQMDLSSKGPLYLWLYMFSRKMMKHEIGSSETPEKHVALEEKSGHVQEMVELRKVWLAETHGHDMGKVTGMWILKTKDVWKREF